MNVLKNKHIKIALIIAIIIVLGGCAFGAYVGGRVWTNRLPLEHDYDSVYSMGDYSLETDENGLFKVLKINDTHLINGRCESDGKTLDGIKNVLDANAFDLIIINGDMVDGFNFSLEYDKENAISAFAELLESYDTPWTFTPGNNDGEIDGDDRDVIAYMLRYPNFITGNVIDIYGDTQFYIDLTHNGSLVHTIAVMDSGTRSPVVTGSYEYVRQDQIENLLATIRQKGVGVSLFFHMQTPAFEEAYQHGQEYVNMPKRHSDSYDTIPKNALFDDMTANEDLIKLISVGHQHGNSMCSLYNGRYYELASPSGYGTWRPDGVEPSVTVTYINTLESATEQIYHFEKIDI